MEFLVDSDEDDSSASSSSSSGSSSSSSSSSSKTSPDCLLNPSYRVAPVMSKWTETSDDDEDGESDTAETEGPNNTCITGILPKADDLFSTVVAQFKVNKSQSEGSIKTKEYFVPPSGAAEGNVGNVKYVQDIPKVKIAYASSNGSTAVSQDSKPTRTSITGTNVKGASPKPLVISSDKEKEKDSAKDRVKRQRLSGQSGIGADFKTWKSEEEMRQRQQYD